MHIEETHHAPANLQQFLRAYAMIVLSILTALGFEHLAVTRQYHAAAAGSRVRIEQEIAANITELQGAITFNTANSTANRKTIKDVVALLQAPQLDHAKVRALFAAAFKDHIGLRLPNWRREAWETAIADQSASHLDQADLRYYTELYSSARDLEDTSRIVLGGSLFDRFADLNVGMQLGNLDAVEALKVMFRFELATQQVDGNLQALADVARKRAAR